MAAPLMESDLQALAGIMRFGRTCDRGRWLFRAGERVHGQFHVRSGSFETVLESVDGESQVTGFYLSGESIPSCAADGRHRHSARALETSSVCLRDVSAPSALVSPLGDAVWHAVVSHSLRERERTLFAQLTVRAHSAVARVAGFCLDLSERLAAGGRDPCVLPTPMTRGAIASYLGLTLPCLSRVMAQLRSDRIIRHDRQQITLLEHDALRRLANLPD
ncbi:MAG: helix-turn-helix domain-containing protein [Pseudomonadota bacterium]